MNFNTTAYLLECLGSLAEHLLADTYEVIVVDNGSNDFRPDYLISILPVRVERNWQNFGFGRACNRGAEVAHGRYLWLLNPDTLVPSNHQVEALIQFLDDNPRYAAAAPLLVDETGAVQSSQHGYFPSLTRLVLGKPALVLGRRVPWLRPLMGRIHADLLPIVERDTDHAVAAALVVRRTAFEAVGGFSSEYFMFLEDTDLCRKFADQGYRVRFVPSARITHLLGKSLQSNAERKRLYYASQDTYLKKWLGRSRATIAKILRKPVERRALRAG